MKMSDGTGTIDGELQFLTMTDDGCLLMVQNAYSGSTAAAVLFLKGVQVKATTQVMNTGAVAQTAQDPGFTTTAFLNVIGPATSIKTATPSAALGIGVASATNEVATAAVLSLDEADPSDTARVIDTGAALIVQVANTTDPPDWEATCADIDMGAAGWLTWGTQPTTAYYFHTLGFAPLNSGDTKMIHYHNAQSLTKMSVSSNVITEEESHDWGADAVAGPQTKFDGVWYMPLGETAQGKKITVIGDSGTDNTYVDLEFTGPVAASAMVFENLQDGTTPRVARALNQYVDTSTDGITWSGGADASNGWAIGSNDTDITNLTTHPEGFYVSKEDGFYDTDSQGGTQTLKTWPSSSKLPSNGQGAMTFESTKAFTYNHATGKFFFDGSTRPFQVGVDAIPGNGYYDDSAAITHEPFQGKYLESWTVGIYQYDIIVVTESSTTKTYITVTTFDRNEGAFKQEFFDQLSGVCRGLFVDSENRLWTGHVGGGVILYWQLGDDGGPDPGRNSIGYGPVDADEGTFRLYLGEVDFRHPYILKQLRSVEAVAAQAQTGLTVVPSFFHDINTVTETTPMTGSISSSGRTQLYVTTQGTNDTFYRTMAAQQWVTSTLTETDTAPLLILKYRINAFLRPQASDFAAAYEIIIDTGHPYDGSAEPIDALTQRTNLFALKGSAPVTVEGVGSITHTMIITEVSELEMRQTDNGVTWVVVLSALDWVDA
jgi:hypothetical protein